MPILEIPLRRRKEEFQKTKYLDYKSMKHKI
jgi:hypothetical protein